MGKNSALRQLGIDLLQGKPQGNFSIQDGNNMIRGAINDACGGDLNRYSYMDHKGAVFAVLSDVLTPALGENLIQKFDEFAETKEVDMGDRYSFRIDNTELFRVSKVAPGTRNIRRQKVYHNKLDIFTDKLAIKIYEDLDRFLAGEIDWVKMVELVQKSYQVALSTGIYEAIIGSYDDLEAPFQVSGTYDEELLLDTIAHVETSTGQEVGVFGTRKALSKIKYDPRLMSEEMKNRLNLTGHLGWLKGGTPLFELPQAYKPGTNEFAVSDEHLLIIPIGEKIVKVVFEGDVVVDDRGDGSEDARNDEQIEFFLGRRVGIGVLKANRYAIYKLDEAVEEDSTRGVSALVDNVKETEKKDKE